MEYIISDATLKLIGDAIRSKTGTTDPINPIDMGTKILGIGGSAGEIEKGVQFVDPFGLIVEQWSFEEVASKTALPNIPPHTNLRIRGWNWTLNEIKEYVNNPGFTSVLHVGAEYDTPNDELRMFLTIPENMNKEFWFRFYSPSSAIIDIYWDGGNNTVYAERIYLTGDDITLVSHVFDKLPSNFEVVVRKVAGSDPIYLCPKSNSASSMFISGTKLDTSFNADTQFASCLTNIYVGKNFRLGAVPFGGHVNLKHMVISEVDPSIPFKPCYFTYGLECCVIPRGAVELDRAAFTNTVALEKISLPPTLIRINNSSSSGPFENCKKLKQISLPSSTDIIRGVCSNAGGIEYVNLGAYPNPNANLLNSSEFYNNANLKHLYIPDGPNQIGINFVNGCYNLEDVRLPETITNISVKAFYDCRSLKHLDIPASVVDLGTPYDASSGELFNMCRSLEYIRFKSTTPPTAYTTKTFEGLPVHCKIYVPQGTLNAYKNASNYPYPGTYTYEEWIERITFYVKSTLSGFGAIEMKCPNGMTWREFCISGYSRFTYNGKQYAWAIKNEDEMAIWDYSTDNYLPKSTINIMGDWDTAPQEGQLYVDLI